MPRSSPMRAREMPMLSSACARSSSRPISSAIASASWPISIDRRFSSAIMWKRDRLLST